MVFVFEPPRIADSTMARLTWGRDRVKCREGHDPGLRIFFRNDGMRAEVGNEHLCKEPAQVGADASRHQVQPLRRGRRICHAVVAACRARRRGAGLDVVRAAASAVRLASEKLARHRTSHANGCVRRKGLPFGAMGGTRESRC